MASQQIVVTKPNRNQYTGFMLAARDYPITGSLSFAMVGPQRIYQRWDGVETTTEPYPNAPFRIAAERIEPGTYV